MYLPCRALQKVFLINEEEHLQNQREELQRDDQSSYRSSSPPMSPNAQYLSRRTLFNVSGIFVTVRYVKNILFVSRLTFTCRLYYVYTFNFNKITHTF